jgi:hypothetical protein
VVGDGNVTSGAVGRRQGPALQPVVLNTGVNESAFALGAAKLKAKIRQSAAPKALIGLGIVNGSGSGMSMLSMLQVLSTR